MAIFTNNLAGMQNSAGMQASLGQTPNQSQPTKPNTTVSIRKVSNGFIVTKMNTNIGSPINTCEHVISEFDYIKLHDLIVSLLQD